jgi:hypothetical protein
MDIQHTTYPKYKRSGFSKGMGSSEYYLKCDEKMNIKAYYRNFTGPAPT